MRCGLMYHVEALGHADAAAVYRDVLAGCELADQLGFDEVWFGEHHFGRHQSPMPAPLVFAAHAAARTERIRLGTAVVVLPLHHPIEVAEQAAVVDVLSQGRLSLGLGSGAAEFEFTGLAASYDDRHERFRDGLARMVRAWEGEPLGDGVSLYPLPLQSPRDLVWLGASGPPTASLAGRLGFGLMLPRGRPASGYLEAIAAYRDARIAAGHDPVGRASVARMVFAAETDAAAWTVAGAALGQFCRRWHPTDPSCNSPAEEVADRFQAVVGSPVTCREALLTLGREAGATHLSIQPVWDGLPQADVLRSISLLGAEVLPVLHALEPALVGRLA